MTRSIALALAFLAMGIGDAQATAFEVVVVRDLELRDLAELEERGAVGLLVPGAGPDTSAEMAEAALVRGEVRNSLRGGFPSGPTLIEFETAPAPPASGPAIVLALPSGGKHPNDRRYPIAVIGSGYRGLLVSESTRIPGLVSIADVAPTALGAADALSSRPHPDAAAELASLDRRIDEHNEVRFPATLLAVGLVLALAFLFPRGAVPALAAALLANLALGLADVSTSWVVLLTVGLAAAVGGPLLALAVPPHTGLGLLLGGVVAGYLVVLAADGPAVALSPFGPTQNSRFFGISNLLETMLLVPALAGAAALGVRFGALGFALIAALALVTVAGNRLGADGGGAVVLAAGFATLAVLISEARRRASAIIVGAVIAVVGVILAVDAITGASSHVTRAIEGGPPGLAGDLSDRLVLSYERATAQWYVALLVAAGVAALALLVVRTGRSDWPRQERAVPLALAVAVAVSLVVNDSPNDVLLIGLLSYVAVERGMLPRRCAARFSSSSWVWSWPAAAAARPSRRSPRP